MNREGTTIRMAKMFDRILLFFYSFIVGIALIVLLCMAFGWIDYDMAENYVDNLYHEPVVAYPFITVSIILVLISIRLFYLSVRRAHGRLASIDRTTEYGDVKISLDTIRSLALRSAGRVKGLTEIKTRIRITVTGVEIDLRAVVDGDTSIPEITEEAQHTVKSHVEAMTGLPVAAVSVFISNVAPAAAPLFKSRVE